MNADQWLLLGIILCALLLFAIEKIRPDVVGLIVLVSLVVTGSIGPNEAFTGFSNPAVITVAAMFVLSAGTVEAGVPEAIASVISRSGATQVWILTVALIVVVGAMSAFMNNIAATVILIPAAITIARRNSIVPSKLLMPLSFGSLLGGLMTLVGTPPNLLASEALAASGYRPFGMFDFAPTGLVIFGVGIIYMLTLGKRLLPDRDSPSVAHELDQTRQFLGEILVSSDARVVGSSLLDLKWRASYGISILEIVHQGHRNRFPSASDIIYAGDILLVDGERDSIVRLIEEERVEFVPESDSSELLVDSEDASLVELVAGPSLGNKGRSVAELDFRARFGGLVLGIWRQGRPVRRSINRVVIRSGDVLLVRIPVERLAGLISSQEFILLEQRSRVVRPRPRMLVALAILGLVISLAATGTAHISVAGTVGVLLMLLFRVVPYERLYAAVEWRILVLIGSLMPLGLAMESSGLAHIAAVKVVEVLAPGGGLIVLAGMFLLTALLTQIMSNAAAVVLIAPLALQIAMAAGISPYPMMMIVAISGSTAFLSPIGHQANLLVYNTGGYRFFDFARVGGPLTLLILVASLLIVPIVWPL
jgi:di/tricarboxylate transporter